MKDLTKADYLKPAERRIRKVQVPGLGGYAYLRSLTVSEKERWEEGRIEQKGASVRFNAEGTRASLLALTLCSSDGRLLGFTDEEVKALDAQDSLAVEQLYQAACDDNGLNRSDIEALNRPNSVTVPASSAGTG